MQQNFEIRGPRLTRTTQHKKNKMYGPDKRLELKIVEKSPRIKIQMESSLPTKLGFKNSLYRGPDRNVASGPNLKSLMHLKKI